MSDGTMTAEEALISVVKEIIRCNDDFRASMPEEWDGDPLQDAVDTARFLLVRLGVVEQVGKP